MEVLLPKWGVSMQEGTLAKWRAAEGARVEEGDPIADVATDKVDAELEAPASGVLVKHCVAEGSTVPVGTLVAIIEEG